MCIWYHCPVGTSHCIPSLKLHIYGEAEEFEGHLPVFHLLCAAYQCHWQQYIPQA